MTTNVEKYVTCDNLGFSLFYSWTTTDCSCMLPLSHLAVAHYLAMDCLKLRYLLRIFWKKGVFSLDLDCKLRFIIFHTGPW